MSPDTTQEQKTDSENSIIIYFVCVWKIILSYPIGRADRICLASNPIPESILRKHERKYMNTSTRSEPRYTYTCTGTPYTISPEPMHPYILIPGSIKIKCWSVDWL